MFTGGLMLFTGCLIVFNGGAMICGVDGGFIEQRLLGARPWGTWSFYFFLFIIIKCRVFLKQFPSNKKLTHLFCTEGKSYKRASKHFFSFRRSCFNSLFHTCNLDVCCTQCFKGFIHFAVKCHLPWPRGTISRPSAETKGREREPDRSSVTQTDVKNFLVQLECGTRGFQKNHWGWEV